MSGDSDDAVLLIGDNVIDSTFPQISTIKEHYPKLRTVYISESSFGKENYDFLSKACHVIMPETGNMHFYFLLAFLKKAEFITFLLSQTSSVMENIQLQYIFNQKKLKQFIYPDSDHEIREMLGPHTLTYKFDYSIFNHFRSTFLKLKIFVTVGTTKFEELIRQVTDTKTVYLLKLLGVQKLTVQYGKVKPENVGDEDDFLKLFDFSKDILSYMSESDLIVSHAGAGTITEGLSYKKPMLVVINEKLMDNHQTELANKMQELKHLHACKSDEVIGALFFFDPVSLTRESRNEFSTEADPFTLFEESFPDKVVRHVNEVMGFLNF